MRTSLNCLTAVVTLTAVSVSSAQATNRISHALNGLQTNGGSFVARVSADGRFVAFESVASNLVPGDTNGFEDCYLFDRETGTTTGISLDPSGVHGFGTGELGGMSADGRFIAFSSTANFLVPGDTNQVRDVFVYDRANASFERVSVGLNGQGNDRSFDCAISADGRFVTFVSRADNLITGVPSYPPNVFVFDRASKVTSCVSVAANGLPVGHLAYAPVISGDGRFVAYESGSNALITGDTNSKTDIYVRDRLLFTNIRASLATDGTQPNQPCSMTAISEDGRFVAFYSTANNLVPNDTNASADIFVRDLTTQILTRESVGTGGIQANFNSGQPSLSRDGRFLSFFSGATNLVTGDHNNTSDVFLRDRQLDSISIVSVNSSGVQANASSLQSHVSSDGRFVAFASSATNLDGIDPGSSMDIFLRTTQFECWLDVDGDGFGDPTVPGAGVSPCAPGYVDNALDCDDRDATRHPGASELPNALDDDCDGTVDEDFVQAYCTPGHSLLNCVGRMSWSGTPSATATSNFVIRAEPVDGRRHGMFFYGLNRVETPWAQSDSSWLCVSGFRKKTGPLATGGALGTCQGSLELDFNAWFAAHPTALGSPYAAGDVFFAQGWYRGDFNLPIQTHLTEAIRFVLGP